MTYPEAPSNSGDGDQGLNTPSREAIESAIMKYPVAVEVSYPAEQSRWKTAFRWPLSIPATLFLSIASGFALPTVVVLSRISILLRRRQPDWLLGWTIGYLSLATRVTAYSYLLTDSYPSFGQSEGLTVQVEVSTSEDDDRSRWRGLIWRTVLVIPQMIVVMALYWALATVTVLAWFAILFTGRYPEGLFSFAVGVVRWQTRVTGYLLMITDAYPPYALSEDSAGASHKATLTSGVFGFTVAGLSVLAITVGAVISMRPEKVSADYERLKDGQRPVVLTYGAADAQAIILDRIHDPGEREIPRLQASEGNRIVVFQWQLINNSGHTYQVEDAMSLAFLVGGGEGSVKTAMVLLDGERSPEDLPEHTGYQMLAGFEIPEEAVPLRLRVHDEAVSFLPQGGVEYRFE